ncbi:hypothetical protein [Paenibacillus alvei]|uniref:Uncharacterized protein n=1 Tax=Paenibacillus alvei TaxID=44250 RepID=A0AAP7DKJ1_PAEAL|nr:hypothetical protein [Paenibacillus alvei]NOJ72669.1 hypothetical protein [Paenibacillus alvei]
MNPVCQLSIGIAAAGFLFHNIVLLNEEFAQSMIAALGASTTESSIAQVPEEGEALFEKMKQ